MWVAQRRFYFRLRFFVYLYFVFVEFYADYVFLWFGVSFAIRLGFVVGFRHLHCGGSTLPFITHLCRLGFCPGTLSAALCVLRFVRAAVCVFSFISIFYPSELLQHRL